MKYMMLGLQAKVEGIAIIKINRPEVMNALNSFVEVGFYLKKYGIMGWFAIFTMGCRYWNSNTDHTPYCVNTSFLLQTGLVLNQKL